MSSPRSTALSNSPAATAAITRKAALVAPLRDGVASFVTYADGHATVGCGAVMSS